MGRSDSRDAPLAPTCPALRSAHEHAGSNRGDHGGLMRGRFILHMPQELAMQVLDGSALRDGYLNVAVEML